MPWLTTNSVKHMWCAFCRCPARFLIGKPYNKPILEVRFFGRCEHKLGITVGSLSGEARAEAAAQLEGLCFASPT